MVEASSHQLTPETVHVWKVDLDVAPGDLDHLRTTLSPDEAARASRYRFPRDRLRFVVSRAALRLVLARHLGSSPTRLRFTYSRTGKPSLARASDAIDLRFNVSHSHDIALFAVGVETDVGIDVERLRRVEDWEAVVARYFTPSEAAALKALPAEHRDAGFFACWTRKEAYLKATGDGITASLDGFSVSVDPLEPPRILDIGGAVDPARVWSLTDVAPGPGYAATLAVKRRHWQLVRHDWT